MPYSGVCGICNLNKEKRHNVVGRGEYTGTVKSWQQDYQENVACFVGWGGGLEVICSTDKKTGLYVRGG